MNEPIPSAQLNGAQLFVHDGGKSGGIIREAWDIGLELRGKTVTGFDGCVELPIFAVDLLRHAGYRFDRDVLP